MLCATKARTTAPLFPPSVGANSTAVHDIDLGSFGIRVVRETTAGSGSRPVGNGSSGSDDYAAVALAIAETGGGGGAVTRSRGGFIG